MKIKTIHKIDYYLGIPLCFVLGGLSRIKRGVLRQNISLPEKPQNILFIKTWGLGNIVMLLPVLRTIRRAYPDAKVHFLSLGHNKEIIEQNPDIDKSYFLDLSSYRLFVKSIISIIRQLRQARIDFVLDFDQFSRIAPLIAWFISRARVGFDTKGQGRGFIYTHKVSYLNDKHMSLIFADMLRPLGLAPAEIAPVAITTTAEDRAVVDRILGAVPADSSPGPNVIIHAGIGANAPIRRWPIERFARLADALVEEFKARVFFTGTKSEETLINLARSNMKQDSINLTGKLNVRALANLVARANLVIANDTSLVHIASAMQAPIIGLYGPNTPFLYGPIGQRARAIYKQLPCSPCITNFNAKQSFCRNAVCMDKITVDEVLTQARELLSVRC